MLHEAGPLAPLIDRVIVLRDGQVVSADGGLAAHTHEHASPDRPGSPIPRGSANPAWTDGGPMIELLGYPFMQRALLAALLTGLIAPAIGTYIVQRRLSLLGDGLGHVAIAGVGLALLTGQAPIPVAVATAVAGAVAVELLRQRGKATGDVGLAILFYGGLAAGVLMSGIAGAGAGALAAYLFGSLTSVTTGDLVVVGVLGVLCWCRPSD